MVKHFPYRPDEVAMLGCENLSTTKIIILFLYIEKLLIHNINRMRGLIK